MKMNKLASVLALTLGMAAANVHAAADQGAGSITFFGSIIDAACSISPETSNQRVELGQIAASQLENNGTSTPRNFQIELESCSLTSAKDEDGETTTTNPSVTVTMGGNQAIEGDNSLFGMTGSSNGAGVVITDGASNQIEVGGTTAARELIEGNNTLSFSAYLQGTGEDIKTGEFQSIVDFTLAYE